MRSRNLLTGLPTSLSNEQFDSLIATPGTRLLRIISPAHFRSEPFLQREDEWVLVLQGEGLLEVAGARLRLAAGDSLLIPAGTPHRVLDTSAQPLCVWLALHLDSAAPGGDR